MEEQGFSTALFYRIYLGKTAGSNPNPLWLRFAITKDGKNVDYIYDEPEYALSRSYRLLKLLDETTIPERFKPAPRGGSCYEWLVVAAEQFARELFGGKARIELSSTTDIRRYMKRKRSEGADSSTKSKRPKNNDKMKIGAKRKHEAVRSNQRAASREGESL